jgi:hypothetical protein
MKSWLVFILSACLAWPGLAQQERRSRLDREPGVVYLDATIRKPIELTVIKDAPVFADKEGRHRLGVLLAGQKVRLEAMTGEVYRVRGQGAHDGIAGWVAPWAFTSRDPRFVENLKRLYKRQLQVQQLIEDKQLAIGMTMEEVRLSRGEPTRTAVRQTGLGRDGRWEYLEYKDVKNYAAVRDPRTGMVYRRLVDVTREIKESTIVDFENGLVSAIEESKNLKRGSDVRIIVPPVSLGW